MEIILSASATAIALMTLAFVVWIGRRHTKRLSLQINRLSERAQTLSERVSSEIHETASISEIQFFLPAKSQRPIAVFEDVQKNDSEVLLGESISIGRQWETELHVRFSTDASVGLRRITWGFPDRIDEQRFEGHPEMPDFRTPFAVDVRSQTERDIFRDWNGFWHIEFPSARFLPKDQHYFLSFTVRSHNIGKYPIEFELVTDQAPDSIKHVLWVEITD